MHYNRNMLRIDKAITITSKAICSNITKINSSERGLLSQNILSYLRNIIEYVAIKIYSNKTNISDPDPNDYDIHTKSVNYIKVHGELRFLSKFHDLLQKSASHYTLNEDGSERLMLKYYEYLLKTKLYLKDHYNLNILENLDQFPLNTDVELTEYYSKIAKVINLPTKHRKTVGYNDRYYVQKVKPFFVSNEIYYEITFTLADSNASKFDRVIAFTKCDIIDNYAIKFDIHTDVIQILGKVMPILIIDKYYVSIRPCEFDKLFKIFGMSVKYSANYVEYKELMNFLSSSKMSLSELVSSELEFYNSVKTKITEKSKSAIRIFNLLDKSRQTIEADCGGANILRYLLHRLNNRILKLQQYKESCPQLSNLYLKYACIPFDRMPYSFSLCQHNPRIYDLLDTIPVSNHEHELLARCIKNNTEIGNHLFTQKKEIEGFDNIDELIPKYNDSLYYKHKERASIQEFKGHLYISEYVEDSAEIIEILQRLSSIGISQYAASIDSWFSEKAYTIDDESKKIILRQMFVNSHVALIYGSAGTGKSTLINHIANFWAKRNKIFLANTHPAIDNIRRKVTVTNSNYFTIAKFLSNNNDIIDCDILFIDECSTVSNADMRKILKKANFKLLVLVGDEYQIESIYFGNWFSIAKDFIRNEAIFELKNPYRTSNQGLLTLWERVRNNDDAILEVLVKNEYVTRLDESIFEHSNGEDEIILCLNYDGLYGVNNINRFLQGNNPNTSIEWGINVYKVGDPILFNESNFFSPLIHNNSKGRIVGIHPTEQEIQFDIELEESINEMDADGYDFELKGVSEAGKSIISFCVNKFTSTDEDDEDDRSKIVPFQIAYAISIHKAQGLEYDSVKIVVTNEVEERITHNIFYTAITRAKNKLKIYWSPETEKYVLEHLEIKKSKKDAKLLSLLVKEHFSPF